MKRWTIFILFAAVSVPLWSSIDLWGVEVDALEVGSGFSFISNRVGDSAPDPIVNTLFVSAPFRFQSIFVFRPEIEIFFQTYGYENGRAVPLESMFPSVMMMALVLSPRVGVEMPFLENLMVCADWSLDFVNRIPVYFVGTGGDQALDVTGWFLSGRFIYTSMSGGGIWQFSELFALTLRGKYYFPLFNLWTGEVPWDQQMFELALGLRWNF